MHAAETPVISVTAAAFPLEEKSISPLTYYSYGISITPETLTGMPLTFDRKKTIFEEVEEYYRAATINIEDLKKLKEGAQKGNFVVPLRFISNNLSAALNLITLMRKLKVQLGESLRKRMKIGNGGIEKLRIIKLLSERINLLWLKFHEIQQEDYTIYSF